MTARVPLNKIFAKSSTTDGFQESLIEHIYNTVLALSWLKQRLPKLVDITKDPDIWHKVFWSCCLHDAGKIAKKFQAVLSGEESRWIHRHEIASLALLPFVISTSSTDFKWIAAGIASHHKDASEILEERYNPNFDKEDLDLNNLINEISPYDLLTILTWIQDNSTCWINGMGFHEVNVKPIYFNDKLNTYDFRQIATTNILTALKGYLLLFNDINSKLVGDSNNKAAIVLRGLITQADHLASAHTPPFNTVYFPSAAELKKLLNLKRLYEHQELASNTLGSIMLTAPTGSGKTEASILWAHQQQVASIKDFHFVYLLPHQASLNAIYRRFQKFFSEKDIALLHGRSLQTIYRELLVNGYSPNEADKYARRANDLARLYHPSIWCTTPYQLLKAAYRLPGYEALWTNLCGSLIVIDEVHAYEPIRMGMFIELLKELKNSWGVNICCMTATMPSWLKQLIKYSIIDTEIPIIDDEIIKRKRHRIEIINGQIMDDAISNLIEKECRGNNTLVCVNTVNDAQRIYKHLKSTIGSDNVLLIHSRFSLRDRLKKELEIEDYLLSSKKEKSAPKKVVVATQVVEVSLNLDFDSLINELAPLEALIQRFGRVNRFGYKGITSVKILNTPSDGSLKIYDPRLIKTTLKILIDNNNTILNEGDIGHLLDSVYRCNGLEVEYTEMVKHHQWEFRQSCLASMRAFQADDNLADSFDSLFDNTEILPISLEKDYEKSQKLSILDAKELLVPIAWRQLRYIRKHIRWNADLRLRVVDLPYNNETGLLLPN